MCFHSARELSNPKETVNFSVSQSDLARLR